MQTRSKCLALAFVLLAFASGSARIDAAQAADYPSRPIHLIVPYAAGGAADSIARILAKRIGAAVGQTIVVENRGGGGSIVGTEFVNKSEPDGYTLLLGHWCSRFADWKLAKDVPETDVPNRTGFHRLFLR